MEREEWTYNHSGNYFLSYYYITRSCQRGTKGRFKHHCTTFRKALIICDGRMFCLFTKILISGKQSFAALAFVKELTLMENVENDPFLCQNDESF